MFLFHSIRFSIVSNTEFSVRSIRSLGPVSEYLDGIAGYLGQELGRKVGVAPDKVDGCLKQIFEVSVKRCQGKYLRWHIDQDVDVAVRTVFASGNRTEDAQSGHPIFTLNIRQTLAEPIDAIFGITHMMINNCGGCKTAKCRDARSCIRPAPQRYAKSLITQLFCPSEGEGGFSNKEKMNLRLPLCRGISSE